MHKAFTIGVLGAALVVGATAHAATLDTFDTINSGWSTDRYAPAGFSVQNFGGDSRLQLQVSEADGASNRPGAYSGAFYNTQGKKIDTAAGTVFTSVQMYIGTDTGRIAGIWATGVDALSAISSYPVLEFFDGQFRGWDSGGLGTWGLLGLPNGFTTDAWHTLSMTLLADRIYYAVDGQTLGWAAAYGTLSYINVMLQGYNTTDGVNRSVYFDNLVTDTTATPLPGTLLLLGTTLGGGGLLMRFRRRRQGAVATA